MLVELLHREAECDEVDEGPDPAVDGSGLVLDVDVVAQLLQRRILAFALQPDVLDEGRSPEVK